jgi:hypothetical protein
MPEKEHFSDSRQADHVGKFSSRANLGKSTKQVDEDLQAFKAAVEKRLAALESPKSTAAPKA